MAKIEYLVALPRLDHSAQALSDAHLKKQIAWVSNAKNENNLFAAVWGIYLCSEWGKRHAGDRWRWDIVNERAKRMRYLRPPTRRNAFPPADHDYEAVKSLLVGLDPDHYLPQWPEMEEEF